MNWGAGVVEHTRRVLGTANGPDGKPYATRVAAVISRDGNRRSVEIARDAPDGQWRLVSDSPSRGFMAEAGVSFARGAATGAAGTAALPFYAGQWGGEHGVQYGGQALHSAANMMAEAMGRPGSGFLGEFASERQHDRRMRRETQALMREAGYSEEQVAQAMMGGSDTARAMTRMPELLARRQAGASEEELAEAFQRRGWQNTQEGYQPGRSLSWMDPDSGMRTMDSMLRGVMGGMDAVGLDQGSMAHFQPGSVKALGAFRTAGELAGGIGMVGAAHRLAGKSILRSRRRFPEDNPARVPPKEYSEHLDKYIKRPGHAYHETALTGQWGTRAKAMAEQASKAALSEGKGIGRRVAGGIGKRAALGLGSAAAIGIGAGTTSEYDEAGNRLTQGELYDRASFRALWWEIGRTGGAVGIAKLGPAMWKAVGRASMGFLRKRAEAGNMQAKALIDTITGEGEYFGDVHKFMKKHATPEELKKFEDAVLSARKLGAKLDPLWLTGKVGATLANSWVRGSPASSMERIETGFRQATDEVGRIVKEKMGEAPDVTRDWMDLQKHPWRPSGEQVAGAFGRLRQDVVTRYKDLMNNFQGRFQALDERAAAVNIDTTGMDVRNIVQNVLTDAKSEFGEEKTMRPVIEFIGELNARLRGNPDYQMTALDARELDKLINVVARGTQKGKYNLKRKLGQAIAKLKERTRDADRELADTYTEVSRDYNERIGKVYRTDPYKRKALAEDIVGTDKLIPENIQEALMRGDRINLAAFREIERTGAVEPLAEAVAMVAQRSAKTRTNELDLVKLTRFLEENDQILSTPGAGQRVKDRLAHDIGLQLRNAVSDAGDAKMGMAGFDPTKGAIEQAVKDPTKMRVLVEQMESGLGKAFDIVGPDGKPIVPGRELGASPARRLLQWSVGHRLSKLDNPLDDILNNHQSYADLFSPNPLQLETMMDVARLKQSLAPFRDAQHRYLQNVKALTITGESPMATMEKFVMSQLGTTMQTLASNLKLLGLRTRGYPYAAGQVFTQVFGVREIDKMLDMFLPSTANAKNAKMVRALLDKDLATKALGQRFWATLAQFVRPALYELEPGMHVKSEDEHRTRMTDTNILRTFH